jgi:uncharacterized protein (TIGR02246 family)
MPSVVMALSLASSANATGVQTIADFEAAHQAAWNAHDANAYAAAFAPDAEIVTSQGWHWVGQTEAAHNLSDGFKLVYAQAHLQIAILKTRTIPPTWQRSRSDGRSRGRERSTGSRK